MPPRTTQMHRHKRRSRARGRAPIAPAAAQADRLHATQPNTPQLLAIAASTGEPSALQTILRGLGADFRLPTLVAQHIARGFVEGMVTCLLFESVAGIYGSCAIGVIHTGMRNDRARGLATLHAAGSTTLAQNEASCVVYGMPQAAVAAGAVVRIEPLSDMATAILQLVDHTK